MSPDLFARAALLAATTVLVVPQQFHSKADFVDVYATVKLKDHTIKTDLVKEDFELFEDGKPVEIAVFSQGIQPLSVVLILDHSGSTQTQFGDVTRAAQEFVGRLLRHDRASVMSLTWDCLSFTDDGWQMLSLLRSQLPEDYGSPIWSATNRALASLETETGQRVVILFSDGEDNQMAGMSGVVEPGLLNPCRYVGPGQYQEFSDVANRAQAASTMVYTVSVGSGTGDLVAIARDTGASFQKLGNYSELRSAFRGIADELHLQYVLGFMPTKSDGKEHKIEVKVKRPGITVRARKAYVAAR
jgi:Ca-activated chloride channel family protein